MRGVARKEGDYKEKLVMMEGVRPECRKEETMQIWFDVEGFTVNVSTHGHFGIYTPKMPVSAIGSDLPSLLYDGSIDELGFEYLYPDDDINVGLEDTEEACREYIKRHLAELQAKEIVALALWEEMKNRPPLTGFGDAIRIGDKFAMVAVGLKGDMALEAVKIIYYDLGENVLLVKYLGIDIPPLLQNMVLTCALQGDGWRRHFTKIGK